MFARYIFDRLSEELLATVDGVRGGLRDKRVEFGGETAPIGETQIHESATLTRRRSSEIDERQQNRKMVGEEFRGGGP